MPGRGSRDHRPGGRRARRGDRLTWVATRCRLLHPPALGPRAVGVGPGRRAPLGDRCGRPHSRREPLTDPGRGRRRRSGPRPPVHGRPDPLPDGVGELPWDGPRAVAVPYRAHCPGSAALLLPDAGVLVAGDMFSDTEVPFLDLDAPDPVGDHHAALARLAAVADRHGVGVLVPGHGSVTDAAGLRRRLAADRAYLDALVAGAAMSDPRLADPWVAGEHERQVIWAGGGRRIG